MKSNPSLRQEQLLKYCSYILLHSTVNYIQHFNPSRLLTVLTEDCSIGKSVESPAQYRSDLLIA